MSGYLGLEGKPALVTGTKGVGQPEHFVAAVADVVHDKQAFEFEKYLKYLKSGSGRAFAKKRL